MKFLVTADNNGAIGRGAQPLVTIPAMQQSFLKETQGKVVVMGAQRTLEGLPVDSLLETASMWYFQKIRPIR